MPNIRRASLPEPPLLPASTPATCQSGDGGAKWLSRWTLREQKTGVLAPGEVFAGRYQVERLLGEGERKRTYLVKDLNFEDSTVALSIVKPHAVGLDPDGMRREANVVRRLGSHPNIVAVYDFQIDSTAQYLVVQFLGGGTLADLIEGREKDNQLLPEETVLRYARQLARALSHLHQRGLIHRDVSPQNVWLDEYQQAHLGDFDSAVVLGNVEEPPPLTTGAYSSPEEIHGGALDQRSDLYSLGKLLASLALAKLSPTDSQVVQERRPDLPGSFHDLLAKLTADSPSDRPAGADEVLRRLDEIRRGRDVRSIIAAGEGPQVEFKSSLRYPHGLPPGLSREQRESAIRDWGPKLEKEVLQTIAAFLNGNGGTLLVGVADDGTIVGIEDDLTTFPPKQRDRDHWQRKLRERVVTCLEPEVWATLRLTLERNNGLTVAKVECPPRACETWLKDAGQEEFYIREASSTEKLTPSRAMRYIREHWPS